MTDGNTYLISKHYDALQEVTAELEQAEADNMLLIGRIEELEAESKTLRSMVADVIADTGDDPEIMAASRAEWAARASTAEAKLAKTMEVVEMIASADVDAVLGEAVDISCEIIGELMEEEGDGSVFHPTQIRSSRVLDAEKLDALLAELRDTLAELKGQDNE
jgi:purine nucleoside phosphorylase